MKIAVLYDVWAEEGEVKESTEPKPKPSARKTNKRAKKKREKDDGRCLFLPSLFSSLCVLSLCSLCLCGSFSA